MYEKITSENVMMFAIKHYDNRHLGGEQEFFDDLKRIKYIKRLFKRYLKVFYFKKKSNLKIL